MTGLSLVIVTTMYMYMKAVEDRRLSLAHDYIELVHHSLIVPMGMNSHQCYIMMWLNLKEIGFVNVRWKVSGYYWQ